MATVTEEEQLLEFEKPEIDPNFRQPNGSIHPTMQESSFVHKFSMTLAMVLPFVGVIVGIILTWQYDMMNWTLLAIMAAGWMLTGWGITIGFHRLMSHRSFETHRLTRAFWMVMGAFSVQGSPLIWCAIHRRHHQLSDLAGDPHTPIGHGDGWWGAVKGAWFSHVGWLFTSHWTQPEMEKYVPDLLKDKLLVTLDKYYYYIMPLSFVIPAVIAGVVMQSWQGFWLGLLWGGFVRTFIVHHSTFSINSLCHLWGRRVYESGDDSRNNIVAAIMAQGEGWHNNHHAFPNAARNGFEWWQIDTSWYVIRTMQFLGLAWNVKNPTEQQKAAKLVSKA